MARMENQKRGSLAGDMRMLLESTHGSNLVIQGDCFSLPVHRAVLSARSLVFAAMLRHDTKESRSGCISIEDVEESVLRSLLHYMYTDEVPPLDGVAAGLLVIADKYLLTSLKMSCGEYLVKNLNIEEAAAIAVLAVTHSYHQLTEPVISFMKTNYLQIIGTSGWQQAMRNSVDASVEICKLVSAAATNLSRVEKRCATPVPIQEKSNLAQDLRKLLKSGEGADITLAVGGSQLRAHRCVLSARSPVFATMLESVASESLDITGDTPEVLQHILHFMYTDEVPHVASMTCQLLLAAVKYGLPVLRMVCEEQLSIGLTIENASTAAEIALTHGCPRLTEAVMVFMTDNFMQVVGTAGWARLLTEIPGAAITICQTVAEPSVESRIESDAEKTVALHSAAKFGNMRKVRHLLADGASIDVHDTYWNRTALHWASAAGREVMVGYLLSRGAAINVLDRKKRTPLHLAASCGDSPTVQLLLSAGAKLNLQDDSGSTPLHCAAQFDNTEAARALLEAGAHTQTRDAAGFTAYDVANESNCWNVFQLL